MELFGGFIGWLIVGLFAFVIYVIFFVIRRAKRTLSRTLHGGDVISTSSPNLYINLDSEMKKQLWKAPWTRDIPFGGDLSASYWVIKNTPMANFVKKSSLIEAYFLRFIKLGLMEVKDAKEMSLYIKNEDYAVIEALDDCEAWLFELLRMAAGKNGVLEKNELQAWAKSKKNSSQMRAWLRKTETVGKDIFNRADGHTYETKRGRFWGNTTELSLTEAGKKMLFDTYGFRNYLLDFTLINERRAVEVELWDEYLVFASLFNIAKQVRKELAALNASFAETSALMSGFASLDSMAIFTDRLSEAAEEPSSFGSSEMFRTFFGGSSFSGGGGGYSGGGSGGGER